ncbi:hypothetical protein TNCT_374161 [Trichonephila clavata]|uniref:Uncharacterized protein n=1 Tax=Trichonephila clavata TaxID=2740835 RepID=A0A8X6KKZ3_TRICU|nr:hypothetical protein TNCT_374161 [Trichonephila clavata]
MLGSRGGRDRGGRRWVRRKEELPCPGEKRKADEEELVGAVSSDNDKDQGVKSDEIERKIKLRNKVRCQRYRDKRKRDITINSWISQHQAVTFKEDIIIKKDKQEK